MCCNKVNIAGFGFPGFAYKFVSVKEFSFLA